MFSAKNIIVLIILSITILLGGYFRIKGIDYNHSFWSDEAYISTSARDIFRGKNIIDILRIQDYQPLHILFTAFSFKLFGISEFSARLLPVIFGTLGIIFAYLLANKFSNKSGGLLAAFLYAFSQLNLTNSTQAKQYSFLQLTTLITFYLLTQLNQHINKKNILIHLSIILISSLSTLSHFLGVLIWIPYAVTCLIIYKKQIIKFFKNPKYLIIICIFAFISIYIFKIHQMISVFFTGSSFMNIFFPNNHIMYFRNLFFKQYVVFVIPAVLGIYLTYKSFKNVIFSLILWIIVILYLWTFKHYTHNIRYLVPLFGIIFVFFGVFWGRVSQSISNYQSPISKQFSNFQKLISNLIPITIILLLIITQYKIYFPFFHSPYSILHTQYFSPNSDFYGDVQTADYKSMYRQLLKKYPDTSQYVVFNNTIETQNWYFPKPPDATFVKAVTAGLKNGDISVNRITGKPIYTTLGQFQKQIALYHKGFLIIEDWESILPEDIKQYAKKNMKRIIRVESLSVAKNDPWPLEVYEWSN